MNKLIFTMLIMLLFAVSFVSATDYSIEKVAINGLFIENETVALDLGTRAQIDVWVKGFAEKDVKVKAWISGYEYDDVQDVSETFQVSTDTLYRKELYLNIPQDLRLDNKNYKLYIEVSDKKDYVEKVYSVHIQERIHDIIVQDVIIRPGTMTDAGNTLAVQVRLKNYGKRQEQDVKVEVTIPQLGAYSVTYVDFLDSIDSNDNSESTAFIPLKIPKDAPTGDFQIKVKALYSNLNEETEATRMIYVNGIDVQAEKQAGSIVLISSKKDHALKEETEYKVGIANLEKSRKSYTVQITGLDDWANYAIMPASLDVLGEGSGEFLLKVIPFDSGLHKFTVKVLEAGVVVKESSYSVDVATEKQGLFNSNRNLILGLMIVVLAIALIAAIAQGMKPEKH
ncbi:MAG: hypothetical protein KKA65_04105 [Nanoarchaeota archaeon]|nr:hypothetical protein [Nanoarchaeota archaeon]MBU4456661.1 hypothetical protein [Nanoarchaeota archaeon]